MLKIKVLFSNSSGSPFKSAELACIKLIHIKNILKCTVIQNKVVIELSGSHLNVKKNWTIFILNSYFKIRFKRHFEDTKGVESRRELTKDRKYNGQKENKQINKDRENTTQKTNRSTMIEKTLHRKLTDQQ